MPSLRDWLDGARPRTLPAAVAPVLAGTGAAALAESASVPRALLAAGVALALQVGVNFANDYSDGIRGTDDVRVGPARLTATGQVAPAAVKRAAMLSFAVAAVLGLVLCAVAGTWWLLAVGGVCIVAAWYYTGGRRPSCGPPGGCHGVGLGEHRVELRVVCRRQVEWHEVELRHRLIGLPACDTRD